MSENETDENASALPSLPRLERRDFLRAIGAAGALSALPRGAARAAHHEGSTDAMAPVPSESRSAWRELVGLLGEIDERYVGSEYGVTRPGQAADTHRVLLHWLSAALDFHTEVSLAHPYFTRIVSPTRKFLGDNPDAVYFTTSLDAARTYRIRGNTAGAVYTSFTVEEGAHDGSYAKRVSAAINDSEFEVAPDGSYEVIASATPQPKNWLRLESSGVITTRHYFEEPHSVAADRTKVIPLSIETLGEAPPAPPTPTDASIAESIRRISRYMRGQTLDQPPRDPAKMPAWVSSVPNRFNAPEKPGDLAFAAVDNAYTMAPYQLGPDEALVIEGSFPRCRMSNVVLWTTTLQSYDYAHRTISRNRKQTKLGSDGRFRMVVAHRDPGVPNWLDTEGRPFGMVYWRFLLPESEIETPNAKVVAMRDVAEAVRG